jgi:scyllo-inositol 2-dehydrogenase (NAD+)
MIPAAVIGCGRMGAFTSESVHVWSPDYWLPLSHADAFELHPEIDLCGFSDVAPGALERACSAYGVRIGTNSLEALLEQAQPMLLGVATRTIGRSDIIETAAKAGVRAIHAEKPLCNTLAELDRLEALLARPDFFITLGTVRRYIDVFNVAAGLAKSGVYGPLVEVRVSFGAASLYWSHPHTVDLILHMAAGREIVGVQARLSNFESGSHQRQIQSDPVIDYATILFDDGVIGHIGRASGFQTELACKRGTITVLSDGPDIELLEYAEGNPYPVKRLYDGPVNLAQPQGSYGPVSQLVSCLQGDAAAIAANAVGKRDIVRGQRILFAMVESHLRGSAMTSLNDIGADMDIRAITGGRYA